MDLIRFDLNSKTSRKKLSGLRWRRVLIIAVVLSVLSGGLIGGGIYFTYTKIKDGLPSISQLENIEPSLITRVYSADDTLLMEFFTERRICRSFDEIPPYVYNAVIAMEDKRFWHHWGVNIYTYPDIFIKAVLFQKGMRGGSTLTQQLARNLYSSIGYKRNLFRKVKELFTAFQIERKYTKKDILQFYLNQVYMGAGAYGFQAAAQKFFGKNLLSDLTVAEAATLAAIIQRPEYYRPDIRPEAVVKRRNLVLRAMYGDGYIGKADYVRAVGEALAVVPRVDKGGKAAYFTEYVRQYLEKHYGANVLYTSGLTVRTTLNYRWQKKAEDLCLAWIDSLQQSLNRKFCAELGLVRRFKLPKDTLLAHIEEYPAQVEPLFHNVYAEHDSVIDSTGQKVPKILKPALNDSLRYRKVQIAFAVLDNKTGAIQAMIGGRNYEESKFNRVTQGYRQPGSAFKPFIYTAAIDNGYSPASTMLDQAFSIKDPVQVEWRPENYDREFRGEMTLRRALALSINTIAIKLQQKVGTHTVVNYAVNMGLDRGHLVPVPSLAIGACESTPLRLFSAYSAFPNKGVRAEPFGIEKILDRDQNTVEEHSPVLHSVLNPNTAYIMTSMLRSVVTAGTAIAACMAGVNFPSGGKTGTTNEYTDCWFVGFTPLITCGVWTGLDEKRSLGSGRTGANTALPVWTDFMLYLYDSLGLPRVEFDRPDGVMTQKICKISYKIASVPCDSTYEDVFIIGTEPPVCDQDHSVHREFNDNKIDPFGSTDKRAPSRPPGNGTTDPKKKRVFMM
ncbi:MAG: PBP1A family penicillin-binding protein [Fibrobacterota bacterium]